MRATCLLTVISLLAGGLAGAAFAQSGPPPGGPGGPPGGGPNLAEILKQPKPILTINRPQAKTSGKLMVTSATLADGKFPVINTGYGKNISPQVSWSAGPAGTASYFLIMEDATAGRNREGVLHWVMFNIPPSATSVPEGGPPPAGTMFGANMEGKPAYSGSHAPAGGPPFHYHIQVFALDTTLALPAGASRHDVWTAINGHVLASGEVIGEFQGPPLAAGAPQP